VYRGLPISELDKVQSEYTKGRRIHWSAFTSTTDDYNIAWENFAKRTGIVFRINIVTGKKIKEYSVLCSEDEVLLSPNMAFIVLDKVMWDVEHECWVVNLIQESPLNTFVF